MTGCGLVERRIERENAEEGEKKKMKKKKEENAAACCGCVGWLAVGFGKRDGGRGGPAVCCGGF